MKTKCKARTACVMLCICLLIGIMPTMVSAASTAPTIKAINFIDGGHSTVYVNEVTSSGAGSDSIKYIYSDDIILHSNVLDGLKAILDNDYDAIIPAPSESTGIASSTSGTPTADWADAEYVAENVISGSGTVTGSTNPINASAASMATGLTTLEAELEAENYATWQTQEAENKAAWEADPNNVGFEYVPSEYVSLDFTETTLGTPPARETNQFTQRVGMFVSGPYYEYVGGVLKESYDINLVCHTVTVLSQTANKAIPSSSVTLPVSTIETATDGDYILRNGVTATFIPSEAIMAGTPGVYDGVKIDYYNPMQNPTGLDSGYSKLVEYHIQLPLTGYAQSTLTGTLTVPLPSGYDGATAKIIGGASATSYTATTVTFPVTLDVTGSTASALGIIAEYKEIQSHTHSYGEWQKDAANHWYECSCGDKSDTAAHTFGQWTQTKAATATENGSKERICSVCGYKETAVITATGTTNKPVTEFPQTGDNSNIILWIVLLFVSGGIIGTIRITKKRKHAK